MTHTNTNGASMTQYDLYRSIEVLCDCRRDGGDWSMLTSAIDHLRQQQHFYQIGR